MTKHYSNMAANTEHEHEEQPGWTPEKPSGIFVPEFLNKVVEHLVWQYPTLQQNKFQFSPLH